MSSPADPDDDLPIRYIERTHRWYAALGYEAPYRYAQHEAVPFAPLGRRLAEARVALLTTAAPYRPELGDQGPGAPYNALAAGADVNTWLFADGVHPTTGGHKAFSDAIVKQLQGFGWI